MTSDAPTQRLNDLTAEHTAYADFTELLNAGNAPTLLQRPARRTDSRIRLRNAEVAELADAYDRAQFCRACDKRAWRGE